MNQNEKLKVVVIELLDSLSNDIAEFLFDRTGCLHRLGYGYRIWREF